MVEHFKVACEQTSGNATLYFSILLHWITIYFAGLVLKGQLLFVLVDCCVLCCSCIIRVNVTSTTCFGLINSLSGRYFYVIAALYYFSSSLF
jgi:hypothetical protein